MSAEEIDEQIFNCGDVVLQRGQTLRSAFIAYKTFGKMNEEKSNVIVYPTWYSGKGTSIVRVCVCVCVCVCVSVCSKVG